MFSKKLRKIFPPGTFLPTPLRILAIIQLCIAFTTISLYASYPFMGALFTQRSQLSLFENVMGTLPEVSFEQANYNREHFGKLSSSEQAKILESYHQIQANGNLSFLDKCKDSMTILLLKMPPFTKAWVFFSVLISILLLRKTEGAAKASWVLPILAAAFAIDAYQNPPKKRIFAEANLFPTEEVILRDYLKEPLSPTILKQHEQLKKGWNLFLIREWAKEEPLPDPENQMQIYKGEFAFNLERLRLRLQNPKFTPSFLAGVSYNPLAYYLLCFWWNLFFAWFMNRKRWRYIAV